MRFFFECEEALREGIGILSGDLGIEISDEGDADITVSVCVLEEQTLSVELNGAAARISFGGGRARFFRGLAILADWVRKGEAVKRVEEKPLFRTNGAMVDMSRNVVLNVKTVKTMLRGMALMGLNMYMLYTEDTYEIKEYPYFGYMRGKYTEEELRELDAYAATLGIELIPCIQMLGHLSTHLRWDAAGKYRDTANVMLVGADATYALIERMLDTVSRCFRTKRLHIGMDETHDLGRGKYLDKNGYREQEDIYLEHLRRVIGMARERGFEPMMWSDMFFRLAGKDIEGYDDYDERVVFTDEIAEKVPAGVQQVYWDYYHKSEEYYKNNIQKHYDLFGERDTLFAGGIWTWSSHCPMYSRSLPRTLPALEACREKGIREMFATIWCNGAESNMIVSLAGLAWYADFDYKGVFDEESVKACFERACGVSYDDMMKLELPDHPDGDEKGLSRPLLYNDPLVGLVDAHLQNFGVEDYYKRTTEILKNLGDMGVFAAAHDVILKLSEVLERKVDFGVRLKAAYDAGDREALADMMAECEVLMEGIRALRDSHRGAWMEYHKAFGWEIHDLRYGGLILRFETAKERIGEYLEGKLDRIEELEEARLRMDGVLDPMAEPRFYGLFNWMQYPEYATASRF